jgi:hypothetical protein
VKNVKSRSTGGGGRKTKIFATGWTGLRGSGIGRSGRPPEVIVI